MDSINFDQENKIIIRCGLGVKFLTPKSASQIPFNNTLAMLKSLPISTYLVADNSQILDANEQTVKVLNMLSRKDTVGRSPEEIFIKDSAIKHIAADKTLIQANRPLLIDESSIRKDGEFIYGISFKLPILNNDNKAIGLLGFSIPFGQHQITPLMDSLGHLAKTGLIKLPDDLLSYHSSNPYMGAIIDANYMTKREKDVVSHILLGKSVPQTAKLLGISPRTAEQHVENLKNKFGVSSKAELIELLHSKLK